VQRLVEGHHLDARLFLQKYDMPIEGQRHRIHTYRQSILDGSSACDSDLARLVSLRTIDDLWADYLSRITEFRDGLPWLDWALGGVPYLSLDRRDPLYVYAQKIHQWFPELEASLPNEIARRLAEAEAGKADPGERGAVWTYLTTDRPFGSFSQRLARGLRRKFRS
jgi:preprotein translocase subunit SecA